MRQILLAGLIGLYTTASLAHSPLQSTNPLDQSTVVAVPDELILTFRGAIRLTRVTVAIDEGDLLTLDLAGQTSFATDYSFVFPDQGAGTYLVVWRGLGDDGHAQTGEFTFTVE